MDMINIDELHNVNGGNASAESGTVEENPNLRRIECPRCHDIFQADISKPFVICKNCHYKIEIKG